MFSRVLVANRGEIAVRVIRGLHELGIEAIAVYSTADEESLHVRLADRAVRIGPPAAAESYLRIPALIAAAETTGCEAVHPGYGFLSENADFVRACEDNDLVFIGPSAETMERMGDKARAKAEMRAAGVPLVPGNEGVAGPDEARAAAEELGFPVLLKAAAGGGGKGMRVVREAGDIHDAHQRAAAEAHAAFGDGSLYVEKVITPARHVEIQVLCDNHGTVLTCGERECSIQRRHQKLLEESPSAGLSEKMRRKMGAVVIDAAKAVQYSNAGTFEFLLDDKQNFYFLEVNTRVQVEHPVTEFITGVDIVKEQIRVAAGERLSFKQGDVTFTGHAIECRVNAEDPETFVPSPGVIHAFSVPGGPGVRFETFAHSECTVSPYYDSMIAKIIVHGRDRQEAIARMRRVLEMTVVDGIKTSIPMHLKILADKDFIAGKLSTAFMERFVTRPASGRLAEAG